jgi:isopenicillin-N N-acyltransferase-like protein
MADVAAGALDRATPVARDPDGVIPMSLPTLTIRGTSFERGLQHGAHFRQGIAAALAQSKSVNPGYPAARERALAAWPGIKAQAPEAAAELEGIASGARADLADILLRSGFEFLGGQGGIGCSAIAASGPVGALVAQNWDAAPALASELALFIHIGADDFECAIVGSIGTLGWVGCNRHGLAIVNNDLVLASTGPGLPSLFVRRLVLGERSVAGAVAQLTSVRHMAGRSYLIGDRTGAVAGVEVSARCGARVNRTATPVLHANHALDGQIEADQTDAGLQGIYPSSRHRQSVLERKAAAQATVQSIAALLSDTDGFPDAVAKAPSAQEPTATLFSVIFDCAGRALHLSAGAPTEESYERVTW